MQFTEGFAKILESTTTLLEENDEVACTSDFQVAFEEFEQKNDTTLTKIRQQIEDGYGKEFHKDADSSARYKTRLCVHQ